MKTALLVAVSAIMLFTHAARADVLSERVVLKVTGTLCPGSSAYEVVAVSQTAFGAPSTTASRPYVVPVGYALEVTDLDLNVSWLDSTYDYQVSLVAQNRVTPAQRASLYTYTLRTQPLRSASNGMLSTATPVTWVMPTGTVHQSFGSGMLVANGARLCVEWPAMYANQFVGYPQSPVTLRGRLHKLDSQNVVSPPPTFALP